jgi:TM2 domain-containing membrane protein YozV
MRNKYIAALLAIFLGLFGIHKFYLGQKTAGIIYLIFFWTGIPEIIGIVEGIIYLFTSEENFNKKYNADRKLESSAT